MEGKRNLTARSHAYLFGIIAKTVIDTYGERGVQAIANGVIRYGRQRGQRMAQRTVADGFELSALNYVLYGEWSSEPGEMDFSISSKTPDIELMIKKCPWHDIWEKNGLLEQYGYLYCKYVDIAIAQGYNTSIQFDVLACRGLGDQVCNMHMRNANASKKDEIEFASRVSKLGSKAKMPWDYHCAHLFKVIWELVVSCFGYEGMEVMQKALKAFCDSNGKEAADTVLKLMETDYNVMPPYVGIDG